MSLQVTVFGQSSGGTSIFALLASPLCKALFHKAWLISASPLLNKTATDAFKDNEIFLKNTGCTTMKCLYSLSPEAVTSSVPWDVYPFWSMTDQNDPPVKNRFDGALAIVDGTLKQPVWFEEIILPDLRMVKFLWHLAHKLWHCASLKHDVFWGVPKIYR